MLGAPPRPSAACVQRLKRSLGLSALGASALCVGSDDWLGLAERRVLRVFLVKVVFSTWRWSRWSSGLGSLTELGWRGKPSFLRRAGASLLRRRPGYFLPNFHAATTAALSPVCL